MKDESNLQEQEKFTRIHLKIHEYTLVITSIYPVYFRQSVNTFNNCKFVKKKINNAKNNSSEFAWHLNH